MASKKTVRILVDTPVEGIQYRANQLVAFPAEQAAALKESGFADDSKAAVDYCKSEGVEVIDHAPAPAEPEQEPAPVTE